MSRSHWVIIQTKSVAGVELNLKKSNIAQLRPFYLATLQLKTAQLFRPFWYN